MADDQTVKDRYAEIIEQGLTNLGVESGNDIAILLVQDIEAQGLMPTHREWRIGDPEEFLDQVYDASPPALGPGQYRLTRYITAWMGGVS